MSAKMQFRQVEEGWIEIYGGRKFHFARPSMGEIAVEAVAHSLSQLCRYNGHTKRFYSVAEHACLLSDWVMYQPWATARDGLTALHHDDAEHIIGDLPRPIKATMPEFKAAEKILDEVIAEKFGTEYPLPEWLHAIDNRIIKDERLAVMKPSGFDWGTDQLVSLGVPFWHWTGRWTWLTKQRFLRRHRRLYRKMFAEAAENDKFLRKYRQA